jgi:hypothetical protein
MRFVVSQSCCETSERRGQIPKFVTAFCFDLGTPREDTRLCRPSWHAGCRPTETEQGA